LQRNITEYAVHDAITLISNAFWTRSGGKGAYFGRRRLNEMTGAGNRRASFCHRIAPFTDADSIAAGARQA
jgi:hypothetical protein